MQINRLILQTSALRSLTDFYIKLMELPVSTSGDNEITIKIGSTELVFRQATIADPFYHFAINIPANKIEEAKQWISQRADLLWIDQYKSNIADFVNWHAKSVYFYDPAGNILELIARFDLHNETNEPFSSKHFLSVSEMGIVCKDEELNETTEDLLNKYQLSYFAKQPPLPQFKAVGDDEGLFIIVPDKRNWFPTSIASSIFPMKIEFEHLGQKSTLVFQ